MKSYKNFKGAFADDELPMLEKGECLIANLQDHTKDGSHWVAIMCPNPKKGLVGRPYGDINSWSATYADPFGAPPNQELEHYMRKLTEINKLDDYYVSHRDYQPLKSDECGYYSMRFCANFLKGLPFNDGLKPYPNEKINDSIVIEGSTPLRRLIHGLGFEENWPTPKPGEDSNAYAIRIGIDPHKAWDFYDKHAVDIANLNLNYYKVRPPRPDEGSFPYWIDARSNWPKSAADLIYAVRIKNAYKQGVAEQNAPIEAENARLKAHPEIAKNVSDAFRKGVVQTAENGVIRDVLKVAGPAAQILGAIIPGAGEVFDAIGEAVDTAKDLVPTEEEDKQNALINTINAAHPQYLDGKGIQSILFDRYNEKGNTLWSVKKALKWLEVRGHKHYKVDIKPNVLRFRQYDPIPNKRYFIKTLPGGIMFVIDY